MLNLDEEQTSLKTLDTDTHDSLNKINFFRKYETGTFKLIEGKNGATTFLPLNTSIGRHIRLDKYESKENIYLREDQVRHVYKEVESDNILTSIC